MKENCRKNLRSEKKTKNNALVRRLGRILRLWLFPSIQSFFYFKPEKITGYLGDNFLKNNNGNKNIPRTWSKVALFLSSKLENVYDNVLSLINTKPKYVTNGGNGLRFFLFDMSKLFKTTIFIFILIFPLVCFSAYAMDSIVVGGAPAVLSSSSVSYNSLFGNRSWNTSDYYSKVKAPTDFVINSFKIRLSYPIDSGSYIFSINIDGEEALSSQVTFNAGETIKGINNLNLTVSTGQFLSIKCIPNYPNGQPSAQWFLEIETSGNESLFLSSSSRYADSVSTYYHSVQACALSSNNLENHILIMPTSGVIKKMFVESNQSPSYVSGENKSRTFTLLKGSSVDSLSDTNLAVTINDLEKMGQNLTDEILVSAGDILVVKEVPSNSPNAAISKISMVFVSDAVGVTPLMGSTYDGSLNIIDTSYFPLSGNYDTRSYGDEFNLMPMGGKLKDFYVLLADYPSVGNGYSFLVRKSVSDIDTDLSVNIVDDVVVANNLTEEIDLDTAGETYSIKVSPQGNPTATKAAVGVVYVSGSSNDTTPPVIAGPFQGAWQPVEGQTFEQDVVVWWYNIDDESGIDQSSVKFGYKKQDQTQYTYMPLNPCDGGDCGATNSANFPVTTLSNGTYDLIIEVSNNQGLLSTQEVTIIVNNPDTTPPAIAGPFQGAWQPVEGQTFEQDVVIWWYNIDDESGIDQSAVKFGYKLESETAYTFVPLNECTGNFCDVTNSSTFPVSTLSNGTYDLIIEVENNAGLITTSEVTVNVPDVLSPVITATCNLGVDNANIPLENGLYFSQDNHQITFVSEDPNCPDETGYWWSWNLGVENTFYSYKKTSDPDTAWVNDIQIPYNGNQTITGKYGRWSWIFPVQDISEDNAYDIKLIAIDFAGNRQENVYSIILDRTAPQGTVQINNGDIVTDSVNVTLNLSAVDNLSGMAELSEMQFSNDNIDWSESESYHPSKNWTLSSGDGEKTVYVKFKDNAGNWSSSFSDAITLITAQNSQININYPFDGSVVKNKNIAVKGVVTNDNDIKVFVNDAEAFIEDGKFLANAVPLSLEGENIISAIAVKNSQIIASSQIRVNLENDDDDYELVLDDFNDAKDDNNTLGFWTSDENSCVESIDINQTHKISWDSLSDYWHSEFFDLASLPKGTGASSYAVLTFLIRGQNGNENFSIELEDVVHGQNFDKTVNLSDYINVTTEWQKVTIPLSDFVTQGVWQTQLRSLVFHFNQQTSGTVYIDDIKLSTSQIDSFSDVDTALNSLGFETSDNGTLVESIDQNGFHKLSWSQSQGEWSSELWDDSFEMNVSSFKYINFDIKGEAGSEDFKIGLGDNNQQIFLDISNYVSITDNWKKVSVPLADFVLQGLDVSKLRELVLKFDSIEQGTIYVDNIEFSLSNVNSLVKPASQGNVQLINNRLFVDSKPFIIKGVGYQPTPVGSHPNTDPLYQSSAIYNRDLPLLRQMGTNTVRTWKKVNSSSFLDACYNSGVDSVYVVMGFSIDPLSDLSNQSTIDSIKAEFTDYVNTYKDHPAVLIWALGNEENMFYQGDISDWYSLANELAEIAYQIEGVNFHPVAIVNADLEHIGDSQNYASDDNLNYIDMWAINSYRGFSYRGFFDTYNQLSSKPVLISEYGADSWYTLNPSVPTQGYENEVEQGEYYANNWNEIIAGPNCVGATLMEYSDEWWKAEGENYAVHNYGGYRDRYDQPDDYSNEEFWGLFSVQDDGANPDILTAKKSYSIIAKEYLNQNQSYWKFRWEFNQDDDFQGWSTVGSFLDVYVRDGDFYAQKQSLSSYLVSQDGLEIDASQYVNLQIRCKASQSTAASIFWKRNIDTALDVSRNASFDIVNDGQFHVYSVLVSSHSDWSDIVTQIGLNFGSDELSDIEIDYIRLTTAPVAITINSPLDQTHTNDPVITVQGSVDDLNAQITVNGLDVLNQAGLFSQEITLNEGINTITVEAFNDNGIYSSLERQVIVDTTLPQVFITFPSTGYVTNIQNIQVTGLVTDSNLDTVTINGIEAQVSDGEFVLDDFELSPGENTITTQALDLAGNLSQDEVTVFYAITPTVIVISSPQDNFLTSNDVVTISGTYEGEYSQITVNGIEAEITTDTFSCDVSLIEGQNLIEAQLIRPDTTVFTDQIIVSKDTTVPVITITTPVNGDIIRGYSN